MAVSARLAAPFVYIAALLSIPCYETCFRFRCNAFLFAG